MGSENRRYAPGPLVVRPICMPHRTGHYADLLIIRLAGVIGYSRSGQSVARRPDLTSWPSQQRWRRTSPAIARVRAGKLDLPRQRMPEVAPPLAAPWSGERGTTLSPSRSARTRMPALRPGRSRTIALPAPLAVDSEKEHVTDLQETHANALMRAITPGATSRQAPARLHGCARRDRRP